MDPQAGSLPPQRHPPPEVMVLLSAPLGPGLGLPPPLPPPAPGEGKDVSHRSVGSGWNLLLLPRCKSPRPWDSASRVGSAPATRDSAPPRHR
ncbi:hypothetical protein FKM82_025471 [Ascaphus truei]